MPFRNEHAARQTDPGQYDTFRRSRPEGWPEGLEAIWGIKAGKSEIQSIRADASKWTVPRFRAWLADHGFKTTIEAAKSEGKMTELAEAYHDDHGNLCLLRQLPPGKDPPIRLVLFTDGINLTTKGPLLFDAESIRRTREAYEDKGQKRLPWDYDHGMMSFISSAETGKAAGWWTPEWGEDGSLSAADIEWTPAADKGIRDKEWLFYSPAVQLLPSGLNDGDPMRVVKVINAAITNLPATKNQMPMVASEKQPGGPGATGEDDVMSTELLKLLGAKTEAEAITALAARLQIDGALFTALGVDGIEQLVPAVEKLKATAAEATKLATEVTKLQNEITTGKKEALIAKLHDEGKLAEAAFGWARTLTYEQLEEHGKLTRPDPKKTGGHDPKDGDTVVLTDAQKLAAEKLGYTEEEYVQAVLADRQAEADLRSGRAPSARKES